MYRLSDDEVIELREDFKDAMRVVRDSIKVDVKRKYLLTKDQIRKIGESSLRSYAETKPTDFKLEDFVDLTDSVTEGDIVVRK